MSASYPTSIKSFSTKTDLVDDVQASHINDLQLEVAAIETALGIGKVTSVAQIVNYQTGSAASGSTAIPNDNTIPQNTEGDQYMSLAITPKSATNKLKIDVVMVVSSHAATSNQIIAALFQDTTAGALAAIMQHAADNVMSVLKFTHFMTAGTTSATTFKVRAGMASGTMQFNSSYSISPSLGGVLASSITITEFKA